MHCSVSCGARPHVVSWCMIRIQSRPIRSGGKDQHQASVIACAVYSPGQIRSATDRESPRDRKPGLQAEEGEKTFYACPGSALSPVTCHLAASARNVTFRRGRAEALGGARGC